MAFGRLRGLLRAPLVVLGVVILLLEEVLWAWLGRLMAALGRWRPMARLEAVIRRLPPYAAMVLFGLPWLIILPVKLGALWLCAVGHLKLGGILFTGSEILGAAILARLYVLCRPSLCQLGWFVRVEGWVLAWSRWAHGLLDRLPLWRRARMAARHLLLRLRSVIAREIAKISVIR